MPVSVDWMDSQYRVIHLNFMDHWTWAELQAALGNAHNLMTKSSCKLSLVLDFLGSIKADSKPLPIEVMKRALPAKSLEFLIIVENSSWAEQIESLVQMLYPNALAIYRFGSHEEAFCQLRQSHAKATGLA